MDGRALSGVRVLDLTQFEAGTFTTEILGWLGADILKVESLAGDPGRQARPWEPPGTDSIYFLLFNSNKRSMALDLRNPEGRDLFLRMVSQADVVVENFAPGAIEKLNLDYPVLREVNPRIIMARIKGFGLSGPYHNYKCFEMIAQAAGGALSTNGHGDREPLRVGIGVGDSGTGVHTALSILAAYIQRQRTGKGQLVESSMQENVINLMRFNYVDHYRLGSFTQRTGNQLGQSVPCGVFPCAPGGPNDYVYIVTNWRSERMWRDLLHTIGRTDLLDDPRFGDPLLRFEHREEVGKALSDWTRLRTKQEAMRTLAEAGVPCSAVMDTADLLDDPHLNERGFIATVDHPVRGRFRLPGSPFRLSDSPATMTPAPLLGQNTEEILSELLGLSGGEIADLRTRRVIA